MALGVVPCPGITASSPQTLSTTTPPVPLNPCPGVVAGTYFGGSSQDWAVDVAADAFGNSYVVGYTLSADFPTTPGAFDRTYHGGSDAFAAKFDPTGFPVYSTYLGGSWLDRAFSVAIDDSGNAYVTGGTNSYDFPTTPGAFDEHYSGKKDSSEDAFVAKLSPIGDMVYSTFLGGSSGYDVAWSISVDASGNAYVTGTSNSEFPTTPGAVDAEGQGVDIFVAKLSPDGTALVYGANIGGSGYEDGSAIVVDDDGNAYIGGGTDSWDFPGTTPPSHAISENLCEGFLLKLNAEGSSIAYSTYLGGSGCDVVTDLIVDSNGSVHATGFTQSADFPTTSGAADPSLNGGTDGFLATLDPSGGLISSTFLGGPSEEMGYGVQLDGSGNVYLTGHTSSSSFPTSPSSYDRTFNGNRDAFVAKLDSNGSALIYSTFLGGGDEVFLPEWGYALLTTCDNRICGDIGYSLAMDPTGNATVVGATSSADFPTTVRTYDATYNGDIDAFLIRIEPVPEPNRPPVAYFESDPLTANDSRVFVDASNSADAEDTDGLLEVRWDWEDDGAWDTGWSTLKVAFHSYASDGDYTIRLAVRDTGGLTNETTRDVAVTAGPPPANNQPSLALIEVFPATLVVGQEATITASTVDVDGDSLSWTVTWGDGAISSGSTASGGGTITAAHAYLAMGAYTVTLAATDGKGGSTSEIVSVTVSASTQSSEGLEPFVAWVLGGAVAVVAVIAVLIIWRRSRPPHG